MSSDLEHRLARQPAEHDDFTPRPAVVCGLTATGPGRVAAEFAARLARAAGWRLVLVPSATAQVKPHALIGAAIEEDARAIVRPASWRGTAANAASLASEAGVPVIIVPRSRSRSDLEGPVVCAVGEDADPGTTVATATRFALEAGLPLRMIRMSDAIVAGGVLGEARKENARMVVVDGVTASSLRHRAIRIPVMVVPAHAA